MNVISSKFSFFLFFNTCLLVIHLQFEDGNEDILLLYVFITMFRITA